MKALVKLKKGKGNISLINVKEKKLDIDEIKIRVISAGICGTDIHVFYDKVSYITPVILGHEFSGIVVECGTNVTEFKEGDKVTAEASTNTCGNCIYCKAGDNNLCIERKGLGREVNGVFADYVILNKKIVHKVPKSLDYTVAALCEPLSIGIHALRKCTSITDKNTVVVCGPGIIGIFITVLAKLQGAKVVVIGLSKDKERLNIAKQLGAHTVINIEEQDYKSIVDNLSGGYGADILFECSGANNFNIYNIVRKGGLVLQIGVFQKNITFNFNNIVFNEINIKGSFSQNWTDFEDAIHFLDSGKIPIDKLSIIRLPLDEWERGFGYAMEKRFLKVMLGVT